jgi:WD40 repeat protein
LALGSGHRRIHLYHLGSWREQNQLQQGAGVKAMAFASDGRTLATAVGWGVNLWDWPSGSCRAFLQGHTASVVTLAFSPSARTLATGSWDGSVRFWDVSSGRERSAFDWQFGKVQAVAFAPDGMTASAAGDKGLVVWDVDQE